MNETRLPRSWNETKGRKVSLRKKTKRISVSQKVVVHLVSWFTYYVNDLDLFLYFILLGSRGAQTHLSLCNVFFFVYDNHMVARWEREKNFYQLDGRFEIRLYIRGRLDNKN